MEEDELPIYDMEQNINNDNYEVGESSAEGANIPDSFGSWALKDFVLIKYETNKRDRFYITKILEIAELEIAVSALRINRDQIVRKFKLKVVTRGKYFFSLEAGELETLQ